MILVVVEHEGGTLDRLSSEALTLGRALAEASGEPLQAVVWGAGAGVTAGPLGAAGVAAVHEIADPRLADYAPEALGRALAQLIERESPAVGDRDRERAGRGDPGTRRGSPRPRRWPPTSPRSAPANRGRSPASGGAGACSRRLGSTVRSAC